MYYQPQPCSRCFRLGLKQCVKFSRPLEDFYLFSYKGICEMLELPTKRGTSLLTF